MTGDMRAAAARDPEFRGIDPPALDHLIKQVQDARTAVTVWLAGHPPPPGVPTGGYRQAEQVKVWLVDQLGMLSRRYGFAITHPDAGGGMGAPPAAPPPRSGTPDPAPSGGHDAPPVVAAPRLSPARSVTPHGAGDLGEFPTRPVALRAGRADARAITGAAPDEQVPAAVWTRLESCAADPDYTEALVERLGPSGAAALVAAAAGDSARLAAVRTALGTASRHTPLDAAWMRAFLADADRAGVRPAAVAVLTGAPLAERSRAALARVDLSAAPAT
ncbi:hypothetical protein [Actinomadura atramentaria]|uniref:hypothetical protein n=1 Tax=Actinomadura atramentaria TaxID=1990 RepID=UPI0003A17B12|nr:hypothetical protein [Actinomadura atramentaria]